MNVKNILKKAEALYQQQQFSSSIELCEKLLAKKPKLVEAKHLLAVNYQGMNQFDKAIEQFEAALTISPENAHLLNNLGNLYLNALDFNQAIYYLQKALRFDAGLAAAYGNLAVCQQQLGDFSAAEKNLHKAILRDGQSAEYHLNLGSLQMDLGNFESALNMLMKALELDPSQGEVYFRLFSVMLYMHRYQDALEVADIGLHSHQLSDIQLCELLVGKATLFWLFDNVEEAQQALQLSEGIYTDTSNYSNIKNLTVFHIYLKWLVNFRLSHADFYQHDTEQQVYFVSESHGFAPTGAQISLNEQAYSIKSLFVRGAKVFHFTKEENNKFKESLVRLFDGLAPNSKLIVGFGEIDCRNNEGIYHHTSKAGIDHKPVIEAMMANYFSYLHSINETTQHELYIYGVPAPHPQAVEMLAEVEREKFIDVIRCFNETLKLFCQNYGLTYLDVYTLTSADGVSNMQYHIDGFHLKPATIIELFEQI